MRLFSGESCLSGLLMATFSLRWGGERERENQKFSPHQNPNLPYLDLGLPNLQKYKK
jgi:hypothetical protein